jgi:myosin heavy subunit
MNFGVDYKVKQYGTDVLLSGGAIAAGVFIFAPEPIVTKIIGGTLALSCLAAGGMGKHYMYRNAYVHQALEGALVKVQGQIETLGTEIQILQATSKSLESTNARLVRTKNMFTRQVEALSGQVNRLDGELAEAFEQLNQDRENFEREKETKLEQLTDEIVEADARGDRAEEKLEQLDQREEALNALAGEMNARRLKLAASEAELRSMQAQLLEVLADNPEALARLPEPTSSPITPSDAIRTVRSVNRASDSVLSETNTHGPDELAVQNLKALASLSVSRGAKVRVDDGGHFDLQKAGFFSQSVPRSFQEGASVTSRSHFFRPVFKFFHDAKSQFDPSELQQAFDGLCSMRKTYASNSRKRAVLAELIKVVAADNPNLQIPKG